MPSGKIDKYEYIIGKEMLTSYQSRIIEQAKLTSSNLVNAIEKQTKTTRYQEQKQIKVI